MDTVNAIRNRVIAVARCLLKKKAGKTANREEYLKITEGRDDWKAADGMKVYSYCGDFVTAVYYAAGCRDGNILNRVAINGVWKPGDNIARILRYAQEVGSLKEWTEAKLGDMLYWETGRGGHVGIMEAFPQGNFVTSIDGNIGVGGNVARVTRPVTGNRVLTYAVDVTSIPFTEVIKQQAAGMAPDETLTPDEIALGGDGPNPDKDKSGICC